MRSSLVRRSHSQDKTRETEGVREFGLDSAHVLALIPHDLLETIQVVEECNLLDLARQSMDRLHRLYWTHLATHRGMKSIRESCDSLRASVSSPPRALGSLSETNAGGGDNGKGVTFAEDTVFESRNGGRRSRQRRGREEARARGVEQAKGGDGVFDPALVKVVVLDKKRRKKKRRQPKTGPSKYYIWECPLILAPEKGKRRRGRRKGKAARADNMLTIGRDVSNDIRLLDAHVSRGHGGLQWDSTGLRYIDIGSSRGSRVNGRPVLRCEIQIGDRIEIGWTTLVIRHIDWLAVDTPDRVYLARNPRQCVVS